MDDATADLTGSTTAEATDSVALDVGSEAETPQPDPVMTEGEGVSADGQPEEQTGDPQFAGVEGQETQTEGPQEIEIDLGGSKHRIDRAALPDEVVTSIEGLQADYQSQTESLAAQRKAVETTQESLTRMAELSQDVLLRVTEGQMVEAHLNYLRSQYHPDLWRSDSDVARQLSDDIAAQERALQNAVTNVQNAEFEATKARDQHRADQEAIGREAVNKAIPGFDKIEADLVRYVQTEYGISEQAAKSWALNPQVTIMAHKAMQYDAMQARMKTAPKPPPKPAPKPVTGLKGKGGLATPKPGQPGAAKLSTDQWMAERNKQVADQ